MTFDEWWKNTPAIEVPPQLGIYNSRVLAEVIEKVCRAAWNAALVESARPAPSMEQWNSKSISRRVSMMDKMIRAAQKDKSDVK